MQDTLGHYLAQPQHDVIDYSFGVDKGAHAAIFVGLCQLVRGVLLSTIVVLFLMHQPYITSALSITQSWQLVDLIHWYII